MYVADTNELAALQIIDSQLNGLGALKAYAAVEKLQRYLNNFASAAGFSVLTVDGKYGDNTHSALKKAVAYYKALPGHSLTLPSSATIDAAGPFAAPNVLTGVPPYQGMSLADVSQLTTPFNEYKQSKSGASSSGRSSGSSVVADTSDSTFSDTVYGSSESKSSFGSIGLILLGLGVVGVGYWLYKKYSD